MEPKKLIAQNHTDKESGFLLRHVKSETEYFRPHWHDYYEIFLMLSGSGEHFVNGKAFSLTRGSLIFIRDFDLHDYICTDERIEFINLAFSKETLSDMFLYLGDGIEREKLLNAEFPPQIRLTEAETKKLHMEFAKLNTFDASDKSSMKTEMRFLLAKIFVTYFRQFSHTDSKTPFWLESALEKMRAPKNFIVGKERFFELCGRTREHATRSLKAYYGVTPSDYINDLRLCYAANLLLSSNLSATDICYECGFKNLSWFYSEFERKFGVSPGKYKRSR